MEETEWFLFFYIFVPMTAVLLFCSAIIIGALGGKGVVEYLKCDENLSEKDLYDVFQCSCHSETEAP